MGEILPFSSIASIASFQYSSFHLKKEKEKK